MLSPPARAMAAYFAAKDNNRPHRMAEAFTEDARLQMDVRTTAISFPPVTQGRDAISEVLVREFNQRYEDIYSVCIGEPPGADASEYACAWMVAMADRQSRQLRVGCGRYDWVFAPADGRVGELRIHIACMVLLAPQAQPMVMNWASALPTPWCRLAQVLDAAPALAELQPWREALVQAARDCEPGRSLDEAPGALPRSAP